MKRLLLLIALTTSIFVTGCQKQENVNTKQVSEILWDGETAAAKNGDWNFIVYKLTHGIVRMSTADEISVIFVSPIVDRYHHFADDVRDSQNDACAYNSGVIVSAFIQKLNQ